jgi:hypothetical protein
VEDAARFALFLFGYPAAVAVIIRWVPVVREQRTRWFLVHQAAVAAIVAGHAIGGNGRGVVVNGAWFVIAAVWYWLGGRRARAATG